VTATAPDPGHPPPPGPLCGHRTAFCTAEVDANGVRHGRLVEFDHTLALFTDPGDRRTADHVSGRSG
jgi:phosphate transport system ATP-binding protein